MHAFIQAHKEKIIGVLTGFDRIRFRGTARRISSADGMKTYLQHMGILLKDFKNFAARTTQAIRSASQQVAHDAGRPVLFEQDPSKSKEQVARHIAKRDGITEGLICVIEAVEPCYSFDVRGNRETKKKELVCRTRKCTHTYHYEIHPTFGFMHTRIQTWLPFTVHVCINGREWLARSMDKAGVAYRQRDNCFTWVENLKKAQQLLDSQLRTDWDKTLNRITLRASPAYREVFKEYPLPYYWSADATEWATDIMFNSHKELRALYPALLQHAMTNFDSREVLRFLGAKVPEKGGVHGNLTKEVVTDMRERPEGIRVKHRLGSNWVKMYDKQGSVLRVETIINHTRDFKVYRRPEGKPKAKMSLQHMRKGVADLHARAEISQAANNRYLSALAAIECGTTLAELLAPILKPTTWNNTRVRGLSPFRADDLQLLQTISKGEFLIKGFRNRELRTLLFQAPSDKDDQRRQAAATSRLIRMLRAHGIVHKTPKRHLYTVSKKGREIIAALNAAGSANTSELLKLAA